MAGLASWLSKKSEIIELGVITSKEGGKVYMAAISGSNKRVYNTLDSPLSVDDRVLIGRLQHGKRYVMNKTGVNATEISIEQLRLLRGVYIDG